MMGATMDTRRSGLLRLLVVALLCCSCAATDNLVLKVEHRYGGRWRGGRSTLEEFKDHDARRHHQRILAAMDLPLGGNGQVTGSGLYYTKLAIGTPPKDFYLQVDTGSDILWVDCAGCQACPTKSDLGIQLALYDLSASSTGKQVTCDQDFCHAIYHTNSSNGCKQPKPCDYAITYADGSSITGIFVTDILRFDQVTGNLQTSSTTGNVSFGCSNKQSGTQGTSTDRVSGIVGLGQGDASIISQLAASGKVKRIFSHCLDSNNGGGIFAIGQVVDPKFGTTPLVEDVMHYNVKMEQAEVGGEVFDVPSASFFSFGRKTVIDSGATLAYLPADFYDLLMPKITARQPNLKTHVTDSHLQCFSFDGKVEEAFPSITFHFKGSLTMNVSPLDYLLHLKDGEWCFGFQKGGMQNEDGEELILLGDIILSNKLVVYDLENKTIGWTPYNCSSSIKVKDDNSGNVNSVSYHALSSAYNLNAGKSFAALLVMAAILLAM